MAETLTPRFGLRHWGDKTDTVSRVEFNELFANIEARGAIDAQDTFAKRPPFGVKGRYYYSTDKKVVYRDTGTAWIVVGAVTEGFQATPINVSSAAVIAKGLAGQTQDILQVTNSSNAVLASFTNGGGFKSGGVYITGNAKESNTSRLSNSALTVSALVTSGPAFIARGMAGQTANIAEWRTSANTVITRITPAGDLVTRKANKTADTDPETDSEFITYGALKRLVSDWQIETISQTAYNSLARKDARTLYVITS